MKNMIYELYKAVDSVENQPYNIYDVYNTIKALGYDDDRVSSEFGLNSVCEVGDIIYEKLNNDKVQTLGRLTLRLLVKLLWALLIALLLQFL